MIIFQEYRWSYKFVVNIITFLSYGKVLYSNQMVLYQKKIIKKKLFALFKGFIYNTSNPY